MVMADTRRKEICLLKDKLELTMNPRFQAEEVEGMSCVEGRESDALMI